MIFEENVTMISSGTDSSQSEAFSIAFCIISDTHRIFAISPSIIWFRFCRTLDFPRTFKDPFSISQIRTRILHEPISIATKRLYSCIVDRRNDITAKFRMIVVYKFLVSCKNKIKKSVHFSCSS